MKRSILPSIVTKATAAPCMSINKNKKNPARHGQEAYFKRRLPVFSLYCAIAAVVLFSPWNAGNNKNRRRGEGGGGGCWWCNGIAVAEAKEIEATREWQKVVENDTVAAGMHVRIDMTTGEKWVKIPDDDDDDSDSRSGVQQEEKAATTSDVAASSLSSSSSTTTATTAVSISANGVQQPAATGSNEGHDRKGGGGAEDYDYEVMHRTLSKLPVEEKARMELPDSVPPKNALTANERAAFELKMKQIWEARQLELQKFQQEAVADLPQVLKDRIRRLGDYVRDPILELNRIPSGTIAGVNEKEELNDGDDGDHIVWVLSDLEYHLSDVDMTRDFYTLGGWPLLVSLLSDDAHPTTGSDSSSPCANLTATATSTSTAYPDGSNDIKASLILSARSRAVQAHAAWVAGTAVKNTGEFAHFAVEPVVTSGRQSHKTTAIDALLEQIRKLRLDPSDREFFERSETMPLQKYLYALGSFLRGNRAAQLHFATGGGGSQGKNSKDGPEIVGGVLSAALQVLKMVAAEDGPTPQPPPAAAKKVAIRLLDLADDIITEVHMHPTVEMMSSDDTNAEEGTKLDQSVTGAFSTNVWCDSALAALQTEGGTGQSLINLQETALKAVRTMLPHCRRRWKKKQALWSRSTILQDSLRQLKNGWEKSRASDDFIDSDIHRDRMELVENVIQMA